MNAQRIELLKTMPAFGGLKPESLELILDQSEDVTTAEGEFFFREGDRGDSLYVLQDGSAVALRDRDGEPVRLGRLSVGDCFGEMSLIDFRPRSASIMAETPCRAIRVPAKALRALYQHDVGQYAVIMMNLGREVSRRLRTACDRLFELHQNSLQSKG